LKDSDHILLDSRFSEDFDHHHIPKSVNLHYKRLLNKNRTFKSPEELEKVFIDAGVTKDKKVIVTC
jgi:thiosulfate/3-mercaptopyruvate sulfurtransferase